MNREGAPTALRRRPEDVHTHLLANQLFMNELRRLCGLALSCLLYCFHQADIDLNESLSVISSVIPMF
jgi:hypothetical protein